MKKAIYKILLDSENIVPMGYVKGYFRALRHYGKDAFCPTLKATKRWENGGKNVFYKRLALYIVASGQGKRVIETARNGNKIVYVY